jgi:hypothetical protein
MSDSQETIPESQKSRESNSSNNSPSSCCPNDALIERLLEKRNPITNIGKEDEAERRRRMYIMLRHSNHYKKLQVWISFLVYFTILRNRSS